MIHQLRGNRSYSVNPGVFAARRAAATGSITRTACTVECPHGASRPSQNNSGPRQIVNRTRNEAIVAVAVERKRVLAATLTKIVNAAVNAMQAATRPT